MHVLNEKLKRLEPVEKKCIFCSYNNMVSMDDCYFVPLFKENDRTNIIVYRSVKYSKILIGISRCSTCAAIHEAAKTKATIYAVLAGAGVFGFSLLFQNFPVGFGGFLSGIIILVGSQEYFARKLVFKKDILDLKRGAEINDTVQDFVINGWSFTQPSA